MPKERVSLDAEEVQSDPESGAMVGFGAEKPVEVGAEVAAVADHDAKVGKPNLPKVLQDARAFLEEKNFCNAAKCFRYVLLSGESDDEIRGQAYDGFLECVIGMSKEADAPLQAAIQTAQAAIEKDGTPNADLVDAHDLWGKVFDLARSRVSLEKYVAEGRARLAAYPKPYVPEPFQIRLTDSVHATARRHKIQFEVEFLVATAMLLPREGTAKTV